MASDRPARSAGNKGRLLRLCRQSPQDGGTAREAYRARRGSALIDRVKAPAGLDLGAITPEEITMSILAEITLERRRGQRSKD